MQTLAKLRKYLKFYVSHTGKTENKSENNEIVKIMFK